MSDKIAICGAVGLGKTIAAIYAMLMAEPQPLACEDLDPDDLSRKPPKHREPKKASKYTNPKFKR